MDRIDPGEQKGGGPVRGEVEFRAVEGSEAMLPLVLVLVPQALLFQKSANGPSVLPVFVVTFLKNCFIHSVWRTKESPIRRV